MAAKKAVEVRRKLGFARLPAKEENKRRCLKCKQTKPIEEFRRHGKSPRWRSHTCTKCNNEYERVRQTDDSRYAIRRRKLHKAWRDKRRLELIAAYGGKCECCGESRKEFLQIDHKNGGGRKARLNGFDCRVDLPKRGFPKDDYRLLCSNCNFALGRYGYCPHKREHENKANSNG